MRAKRVWMYYCEFCKKKGMRKGAMETHEKHCTMNPDRDCRMCAKVEADAEPLPTLIALLPDPKDYEKPDHIGVAYVGLDVAIRAAIEKLRSAAGGCPMCMLAAIRQSPLAEVMWIVVGLWDYKKELKSVWAEYDANEEARYVGY